MINYLLYSDKKNKIHSTPSLSCHQCFDTVCCATERALDL